MAAWPVTMSMTMPRRVLLAVLKVFGWQLYLLPSRLTVAEATTVC